jgi:hypothetical protein
MKGACLMPIVNGSDTFWNGGQKHVRFFDNMYLYKGSELHNFLSKNNHKRGIFLSHRNGSSFANGRQSPVAVDVPTERVATYTHRAYPAGMRELLVRVKLPRGTRAVTELNGAEVVTVTKFTPLVVS